MLIDHLFYADGSIVFLKRKAPGVVRHQVFKSLEPMVRRNCRGNFCHMQDGDVLEITTDLKNDGLTLERYFYMYDKEKNCYVKLNFPTIEEEMEGEFVLGKHLGLTT